MTPEVLKRNPKILKSVLCSSKKNAYNRIECSLPTKKMPISRIDDKKKSKAKAEARTLKIAGKKKLRMLALDR